MKIVSVKLTGGPNRFTDPVHMAALLRGDYGSNDPPRLNPVYCEFCKDVPEDDLFAHGGCACCGNNGYYSSKEE